MNYNTLTKKMIACFSGLATVAALLFTPAHGQGVSSREALKKCEAEFVAGYAAKIAKAQADGESHLVPGYEQRRSEVIRNLCPLMVNDAPKSSEIAPADQKTAANRELKQLFDEVKRIADKITAGSTNPADFRDLNVAYAKLRDKQSAFAVSEKPPAPNK